MKGTQNLYLKTMYMLYLQHNKIRVTDIANNLNYSKSSVSKALLRLKNNNLIFYETYGDIVLTKEAKTLAEQIIIKENLLELFFVGILNVDEDIAKKDIDIISQYVSMETKYKLKEYIKKTIHIDNELCNCNVNINPACEGCETKIIKNRVDANPKWIKVLKEKE